MNEPYEITRKKIAEKNRVVFFIEVRGQEFGDSFYGGAETWESELQAFANRMGEKLDEENRRQAELENL